MNQSNIYVHKHTKENKGFFKYIFIIKVKISENTENESKCLQKRLKEDLQFNYLNNNSLSIKN